MSEYEGKKKEKANRNKKKKNKPGYAQKNRGCLYPLHIEPEEAEFHRFLSIIGFQFRTHFCEFIIHSCYGKSLMLIQDKEQMKMRVSQLK